MGKEIINRAFLVESFKDYDKYALYDAIQHKIVDSPAGYVVNTSPTSDSLLVIDDSVASPGVGEIGLSTIVTYIPTISIGDYVDYIPEEYHYETEYVEKYIKGEKLPDYFDEYTKEEIEDLFDLSPEQIQDLKKLINDDKISSSTLWTSLKTNNEILAAIAEANKYADGLIGELASVSMEIVNVLPVIGSSNTLYILQNGPGDMPVYIYDNTNKNWIDTGANLGTLSLQDYYTKVETDTILEDYIKKTEGLTVDDFDVDPIDFNTEY